MKQEDKPSPLVNVLAPLTGEHKTVYEGMFRDYVQLFGLVGSSKQQAAARLAGILVVAASIGELPVSIVFRNTLDLPEQFWVSGGIWNAQYLNDAIDEKAEPICVLKAALHLQGGIAGEFYSNLNHPTSLLEDLYISSVCTGYVSLAHNLEINSLTNRIAFKTSEIIDTNKEAYTLIFQSFGMRTGIPISELREILSAVPLTELNSLVTRSQ